MAVVAADLQKFSSLSRSLSDSSTIGGAIDLTFRNKLDQPADETGGVSVVSDNAADTNVINILVRGSNGLLATRGLFMNGVTPVTNPTANERYLNVIITAPAVGTVTISSLGAGLPVIATILPGEVGVQLLWGNSTSQAIDRTLYDKIHWENTNGVDTLVGSFVTLVSDPLQEIMQGVALAINDSATIANRTVAPAGVTFVDDNILQNVPGGGTLGPNDSIGVWWSLFLPAFEDSAKAQFVSAIQGAG